MAVTNYFTEDGVITGQETGGVYTDYLTDALGSITATVDQSQSVVNTYRYKPFGSRLAKTGAGADPPFQWVGGYGYKNTDLSHSSHYVRARHYGQEEGRWTTVDGDWPSLPPFAYVNCNPSLHIDPSGYDIRYGKGCTTPWGETKKSPETCYAEMCKQFRSLTQSQRNQIQTCIANNPPAPSDLLKRYEDACKSPSTDPKKFCVFCRGEGGDFGLPSECAWMVDICNTIRSGFEQIGYSCPPVPISPGGSPGQREKDCKEALNKVGCSCGTIICPPGIVVPNQGGSPACCKYAPLHELGHCITDHSHSGGVDQVRQPDWMTKVSFCICEVLYGTGQCGCLGLQ